MDEGSLKTYQDLKNSLDLAKEEGRAEGREEGRIKEKRQVVINALNSGLAIDVIVQITGLTAAEIEKIKKEKRID